MTDPQVHIALLGIFVTIAIAVITAAAYVARVAFGVKTVMDRFQSIMHDYPPHRHIVNGSMQTIVYPDGFAPSTVEKISMAQSAGH